MGEHKEHRIYDECGHDHREGDPGTVEVLNVGICCEEGYMYSICYWCHTDDGEILENSPDEQAWPCDAAVAQALLRRVADRNAPIMWMEDGAGSLLGDIERALAGEEDDGSCPDCGVSGKHRDGCLYEEVNGG